MTYHKEGPACGRIPCDPTSSEADCEYPDVYKRQQMNHSTQFWQEVAQVLPDYRKRKAWLTENGWRLMG